MLNRHTFALAIGLGCWLVSIATAAPPSTFSPGDLLLDEFFNGWHHVDPNSGQATPLTYPSASSSIDDVVVDHSGRAVFASNGTDLYELDLNSQQLSVILTLPNAIDGIAVSSLEKVYVATDREVVAVDRVNHTYQTLKTDTFFAPQAIALNPVDGFLYVSEFFNDLWRINPTTGQSTRVNVPVGSGTFWDDLVALPNGDLVAVDSSRNITRIDTVTGLTSVFSPDMPPFPMRSMAVDLEGNIVVTAASSIFRYNGLTGARSVLTPSATFFSPHGVAVVPVAVTIVPEPASASLAIAVTSLVFAGLRRRSRS